MNGTKPRLEVMTQGDDDVFDKLHQAIGDREELGGIDHFTEESDTVDGEEGESVEMAEGRFTRTTRRLMTVLQLNDRERPVAMDNIRLVAITSERTFDICHESRCLQYREDMGFFLRVITSDKELRDTDYVFKPTDRALPPTGVVAVENGGPVLALELNTDSMGQLVAIDMAELMDRVRSDPVRILSMVTLVNCASSCKVFDLAMYFSSKSRKQRYYITPSEQGGNILVHPEPLPGDTEADLKLFFQYNTWSKSFNNSSSGSNGESADSIS